MKKLYKSLGGFCFKPASPYPLCVFRILFGLCVTASLLLLRSDWLAWFGVKGWVSMATIGEAETGFRLNLFEVMPQNDHWIAGFFWVLLAASLTLTLGLGARISSVIVYLGLNSLDQRNPLILHAGDTFLRAAAFFLMFAPSGAVLSLDNMLRRRRGVLQAKAREFSPWAQRLIQFQFAMVYLASFWWKAKGSLWRSGMALYYVVHLREVQRFPIPAFFYHSWVLHAGTWLAMAFELAFPLLVWFEPFRKWILIAGLMFHLSLEYAFNIPMFQWDMLCAYPLFLDPGWLKKQIHGLAARLRMQRNVDFGSLTSEVPR
jgi:Vitamin K-dependent gamma-carboxylase